MSPRKPWDPDWDWYDAPAKRPPPKRGIKVKKPGSTWWGKRWIEALERMSSGYSTRLARGKNYARTGRVHDLDVGAGAASAKVTGSREPYDVRIELPTLSDEAWRRAVSAMAAKAQFAAELLDGRMPEEIDNVFLQAGRSLFPIKAADVRTECSCPDWANPCKHVAAVHFVLGEAFDRDPFLLFELRGRTKAEVLDALRAARAGGAALPTPRKRRRGTDAGASQDADIATVSLGRLKADDYDTPPRPLPALRFHFDAPESPGALLRQLGAPNGWSDASTPAEKLAPIVHAAAATARRLALAHTDEAPDEPSAPAPPDAEPAKSRRARRPPRR